MATGTTETDTRIFTSLEGVDIVDYVREHSYTLTFPMKLMLMIIHVERAFVKSGKKATDAPLHWVLNGEAFAVRSRDALVKDWLPIFFPRAKFSSFTRKLYRWRFRQVNFLPERGLTTSGSAAAPENNANHQNNNNNSMFFGNEFFQRDNPRLLSKMKSVTAAGTRREQAALQDEQKRSASAVHLHLSGMLPVIHHQACHPQPASASAAAAAATAAGKVHVLAQQIAAAAAAASQMTTTAGAAPLSVPLPKIPGLTNLLAPPLPPVPQQQQQQQQRGSLGAGQDGQRSAVFGLDHNSQQVTARIRKELEAKRLLARLQQSEEETIASRHLLALSQQQQQQNLNKTGPLAPLAAQLATTATGPIGCLSASKLLHTLHHQQHRDEKQQQQQQDAILFERQRQQQQQQPSSAAAAAAVAAATGDNRLQGVFDVFLRTGGRSPPAGGLEQQPIIFQGPR